MATASTTILLVGTEDALLEGLSQSLAGLGYTPRVAHELVDAREIAASDPPLIVVIRDNLAAESSAGALRIPLAPGGALVLYHTSGDGTQVLSPSLRRTVLAELSLPLERHRLIALVEQVVARSAATGRRGRETPPEQRAH
jgi:DNA-binding NtrC family response regulator